MSVLFLKLHQRLPWAAHPKTQSLLLNPTLALWRPPGDPIPSAALPESSSPPPTPGSKLPTTPRGQGGWSRIWTRGLHKGSLSCWAGWHPPVLSPEEVALWDYCLSVETWGQGRSEPIGAGPECAGSPPSPLLGCQVLMPPSQHTVAYTSARICSERASIL